jgi:hypothetical protein
MRDLAESATAVCCNPVCSKRFALGRCQNQHHRAGSRRKVARYCSNACRQAAYRERAARKRNKLAAGTYTLAAVTASKIKLEDQGAARVKKTTELPILPDARYPTMFRVQLPDGTVTDMVNLTRANDAAAIIARDLMRNWMLQGNWADDRLPKADERWIKESNAAAEQLVLLFPNPPAAHTQIANQ